MVTQILKKLSRSGTSGESERQENRNSRSLIPGAGTVDTKVRHSRSGGEFSVGSGFDSSSMNGPAVTFPGSSLPWANNTASYFYGLTGFPSGSRPEYCCTRQMSSSSNQNQNGNNMVTPACSNTVTVPVSTPRFCTPATAITTNASHSFVNNIITSKITGINPFSFPGVKIVDTQRDVTKANNIDTSPFRRGMGMVMGVQGAVETLTKKCDLDTLTSTTITTTTTRSKDEKMPHVPAPAPAPAPDSLKFHCYAPTKRTKKVAKRGKRHNLLRKMSDTLPDTAQKTEQNSLLTNPQDKHSTNRAIVEKGHHPHDQNNEEPHSKCISNSKRIPEQSSIHGTGDTGIRSRCHQKRHMMTVRTLADEGGFVRAASAKKRKARSAWNLEKEITNAKDIDASSPPREAQQKGRKMMKKSTDTSEEEAQDQPEKEECRFDTILPTTTDENTRQLHKQVDPAVKGSSSDTITNALDCNQGFYGPSREDAALGCFPKQPPEALYHKPETKLTCDEEIKEIVEYASNVVASVLRSRTFLTFMRNQRANDPVIEDNPRTGPKTESSHSSAFPSATPPNAFACESVACIDDTVKPTGVATKVSDEDSANSVLYFSLAVQRFAVEVYYPYLVASKKTMGNESPRCDRVLLSTFLALREMLITNADQVFNSQDLMRTAGMQPPGKVPGCHLEGKASNRITGIDSFSFIARNIASMIIRLAAQEVSHQQGGSKFYQDFIAVANNYDTHSDDFRFCLRHADARSSCVLPNGRTLGEEESKIAKTSFNLTRNYHPLIYNEQQEQEISLSLNEDSVEVVDKVEAKNKLVLPRANACAIFVMAETPTQIQPQTNDSDLELVGNQNEALDSYNKLKEAQRERRRENLRKIKRNKVSC